MMAKDSTDFIVMTLTTHRGVILLPLALKEARMVIFSLVLPVKPMMFFAPFLASTLVGLCSKIFSVSF